MITRKQKEETVKRLKDKFGKSNFIAFLNFHGLSVAKATGLRRALKNAGAEYTVAKKTLLGVAAKESKLDMSRDLPAGKAGKLEGEIGVVTGGATEDGMLSVAKEIAVFAKRNKDILKIIGGFWDKDWIGPEEIKRFAAIPLREVLLTQIAFIISQPIANFARVLKEVEKKLSSNQ